MCEEQCHFTPSEVKKLDANLRALLDQREQVWDAEQREVQVQHLKNLVAKGKNRENYIDKVLAKCKTWGGPFLQTDTLMVALKKEDEDGQQRIIRHEITFQKSTLVMPFCVKNCIVSTNKQSE